jgi:hypothetical protein
MDKRKPDLHLHEQILLLALRDEKGTPESKAGMYRLALGGAILSELLLAGCIVVGEDKKKRVELVKTKRLYDPILDECLGLVASAKRRRSAQEWVGRFARTRRLYHRVAEGLCRRGVLRNAEDTVLLFFTRKVYPTIDLGPERQLVRKLRRAIFSDTKTLNDRIGILIALAHATGLIRAHFDRRELKERKRRLDQITKGDLIGGATRQAVQAAQAAAVATIAAAAVVTSAASR